MERTEITDIDTYFTTDQNVLIKKLELLMSEASSRSLGGLRTEDQKFAYTVYDHLRDTLQFIDRYADTVTELTDNLHDKIRDLETDIGELEHKMKKIHNIVKEY